MPKPSFTIARKDGIVQTVLYNPLLITIGGQSHRLALHRGPGRDWMISDPESGIAVVSMVYGLLLGRPDSGKAFKLAQIRPLALRAIDLVVARHGADTFNARLARHRTNRSTQA